MQHRAAVRTPASRRHVQLQPHLRAGCCSRRTHHFPAAVYWLQRIGPSSGAKSTSAQLQSCNRWSSVPRRERQQEILLAAQRYQASGTRSAPAACPQHAPGYGPVSIATATPRRLVACPARSGPRSISTQGRRSLVTSARVDGEAEEHQALHERRDHCTRMRVCCICRHVSAAIAQGQGPGEGGIGTPSALTPVLPTSESLTETRE